MRTKVKGDLSLALGTYGFLGTSWSPVVDSPADFPTVVEVLECLKTFSKKSVIVIYYKNQCFGKTAIKVQ